MNENSMELSKKFERRLHKVGLAASVAVKNLRRAFLGLSGGSGLDKLGELHGIKRKPFEFGGNFRKRMLTEIRKEPKFK